MKKEPTEVRAVRLTDLSPALNSEAKLTHVVPTEFPRNSFCPALTFYQVKIPLKRHFVWEIFLQ